MLNPAVSKTSSSVALPLMLPFTRVVGEIAANPATISTASPRVGAVGKSRISPGAVMILRALVTNAPDANTC